MAFADWLRQHMAAREMNQSALAYALGLKSQSTISAWLRGKAFPDDKTIGAIATLFEVERSYLYQLLGRLERPQGFSPEMAARVERIENLLASIEDDRVKEIVITKLDNSFAETVDLVERLQDLLDKQSTPPD